MRSPRLSASSSRTGPSGALAGGEQRARERGEQRAQAVERGDGEDAGGERERAQQQAGERPERPRPDVEAVAQVADPADAEDQQPGGDRDREEPGGEPEQRDRQLDRHQHEHAPVVAVAERGDRAAPQRALVVRGRRERGDVRVEQPVGLAALELGEARAAGDREEHDREADPDRAERGAEHEQRGGRRAHDAQRQAEDEVLERLDRAPQATPEVDRVAVVHGPLPTRTSPVVESAWTWNGASSPVVTPRTLRLPSSLSASTR